MSSINVQKIDTDDPLGCRMMIHNCVMLSFVVRMHAIHHELLYLAFMYPEFPFGVLQDTEKCTF